MFGGARAGLFPLRVCVEAGTELLHVPAQAYGAWWEVLERGSSYAAPLLWIGFQQFLCQHGVIAGGLLSGSGLRFLAGEDRRSVEAHTVISSYSALYHATWHA